MKYNKDALAAAGRYCSRASLILISVILASATCTSISAAVRLVVSRFSTSAVSPRKLPPAADRRESKESSSSFSLTVNSFCCRVSFACKVENENT